jgi:formylmethanofuran dehydrogenase subunit C
MLAGSILVFGNCGIRHGAGMRRGTIALLGEEPFQPLPTFRHACRCCLEFLRVIDHLLRRHAFEAPFSLSDLPIDLYHGDLLEGGRGELLLRTR